MRSSINKIVILTGLFMSFSQAYALDTTKEESTCGYIGFKKGTESFGNCVLELLDRKKSSAKIMATQSSPKITQSKVQPQVQATGDGSQDDATCQKYGFKPNTNEYSTCRLQIDQAKQQQAQQQAQYDEQMKQYKEAQRQRSIQANLALMQRGLNMMAGGGGGGVGPAPTAPVAPIQNQTYMLPGNKMMTCNTNGNVTSCF
jgi:hypothetical protein